MNKITFFFILLSNTLLGQTVLPVYPDSIFSTYYHQRVSHFRTLPQTKEDIIFLGNSITDGAEWSELFANSRIKNRGISGDVTAGVIHRIDEIAKGKPAKVFLLIGTNDLDWNIPPDTVAKNILLIAAYLHQQTSSSRIYVQSILPVNNIYKSFDGHPGIGEQIKQVNAQLKQNALMYHYIFINLYTPFSNGKDELKENLSNDGLHLNGEGYLLWKQLLNPFINTNKQ